MAPVEGNTSEPDPAVILERLRDEATAAGVPVAWDPADGAGPLLATVVLGCSRDPVSRLDAAFALEAVFEGFLCHQGVPRLFSPDDGDLALLTGDLLYALGLRAVASDGDTAAVEALSELIGASAAMAAEGRNRELGALWPAQAVVLADPSGEEWRTSARMVRDGGDDSGPGFASEARERAAAAGAERAFGRATDALQSMFRIDVESR